MVSSEDRLTERGANPRTGLVSPFVTSESELGHDHDYLSMGRAGRPQPFAKARTRSGKWKQDGLGWSLVESPLLSPIAQSTNAPPTRQVSLKELEDRLLVQMPVRTLQIDCLLIPESWDMSREHCSSPFSKADLTTQSGIKKSSSADSEIYDRV